MKGGNYDDKMFCKVADFFYFYIYPPTLLLYVATDSI